MSRRFDQRKKTAALLDEHGRSHIYNSNLESNVFLEHATADTDDCLHENGSVFPDSESSSSSSEDESEFKWSIASNTLFLLGSSIQAIGGIRDLISYNLDDDGDEDEEEAKVDSTLAAAGCIMFVIQFILNLAWNLQGSELTTRKVCSERAHQREIFRLGTFGFGALAEGTSIACSSDGDRWSYHSNMLSCHLYLISACTELSDIKFFECWSTQEMLTRLGDVLFLLGSLIDTILSYLYDPELSSISAFQLAQWNLLSNALWFLDAALYLLADCTTYNIPEKMIDGMRFYVEIKCRKRRNWSLPFVIETKKIRTT